MILLKNKRQHWKSWLYYCLSKRENIISEKNKSLPRQQFPLRPLPTGAGSMQAKANYTQTPQSTRGKWAPICYKSEVQLVSPPMLTQKHTDMLAAGHDKKTRWINTEGEMQSILPYDGIIHTITGGTEPQRKRRKRRKKRRVHIITVWLLDCKEKIWNSKASVPRQLITF